MEVHPINGACSSGILEGCNGSHVFTLTERFDMNSPLLGTTHLLDYVLFMWDTDT